MDRAGIAAGDDDPAQRYLDLLKRMLTRHGFDDDVVQPVRLGAGPADRLLARLLRRYPDAELVRRFAVSDEVRARGGDLPSRAETMVGLARLDNLADCVRTVIADGIPGDLIETGVWRGGACIYLRGLLAAYGDTTRSVWVADSFAGLPPPDPTRWPADAGDDHWTRPELAISRAEVEANFARYGLLDERVRFLEGWFEDTLPAAPIESLAVARLDGDMYGSTMTALTALYDRVSIGGFVIIDDYGAVEGCRQATDEFRRDRGISDPLVPVDWTAMYWRRTA